MELEEFKTKYPKGRRIGLVRMKNINAKDSEIPVSFIEDIGTVHTVIDNGETIRLIITLDRNR